MSLQASLEGAKCLRHWMTTVPGTWCGDEAVVTDDRRDVGATRTVVDSASFFWCRPLNSRVHLIIESLNHIRSGGVFLIRRNPFR